MDDAVEESLKHLAMWGSYNEETADDWKVRSVIGLIGGCIVLIMLLIFRRASILRPNSNRNFDDGLGRV